MSKNRFSTYDIGLSAFLLFSGVLPSLEKMTNGRVIFYFDSDPNLYKTIDDFNKNALVPVSDFVNCLKALRGRMLTVRGGQNG